MENNQVPDEVWIDEDDISGMTSHVEAIHTIVSPEDSLEFGVRYLRATKERLAASELKEALEYVRAQIRIVIPKECHIEDVKAMALYHAFHKIESALSKATASDKEAAEDGLSI